MAKPLAWSYSALTSFETCPKRHYLTKVAKEVKEPQNEASAWGLRVHRSLEHRVASGTPLPDTLKQYEPMAKTISNVRARGAVVRCEQKLALDKNFVPVTWFAPSVWCRSIVDVLMTKGSKGVVLDYKTGAKKPDSLQLKLSAAMVMAATPGIQKVTCSFIWLKDQSTTVDVVERAQTGDIWNEFLPRVSRMEMALRDNNFPARPSGLCARWCPCTKCEHNGGYVG